MKNIFTLLILSLMVLNCSEDSNSFIDEDNSISLEVRGAEKVLICHQTNSKGNPEVNILVAPSAVEAHLAHGDYFGRCYDCSECLFCEYLHLFNFTHFRDLSKEAPTLRKTQYRLYAGNLAYIDVSINYKLDRRSGKWVINRDFKSFIEVVNARQNLDEIILLWGDIEEVSQETLEFCADKLLEIADEQGLL